MRRPGTTLIEMLVAIAILALVAGVVAMGARGTGNLTASDDALAKIAAARTEAIDGGRATTVVVNVQDSAYLVTAYPDGRVLTAARFGIAPLTGRPDAAR